MLNSDFVRWIFEAGALSPLPVSLSLKPAAPSGGRWAEVYGGRFVWIFPERVTIPKPVLTLDLCAPADLATFNRSYAIHRD